MTRYLVIKEEECQRCKGSGWVMHYLWKRYYREHPEGIQDPDEHWNWWASRSRMVYRRNAIPSEEVRCICGDGLIKTEVPKGIL